MDTLQDMYSTCTIDDRKHTRGRVSNGERTNTRSVF